MESDVSRLAAQGLTNPEIGARLYISRRTVETHLSHVFRKVGVAGRTHLAAELTRRGPPPEQQNRERRSSDATAADDMKWRPQP